MSTRLRVLIVDDSEDSALLIGNELEHNGYDLVYDLVYTEANLLSALHRQSWDIIITNYNMPEFGFYDVLTISKHFDPDLPVIIVSDHIGEESAVEAIHAGANDCIIKHNLKRIAPAIKREFKKLKSRKQYRFLQSRIQFLAFHDALTGLVNRHEFENQLVRFIESAREFGSQHAVLYMDLDHFKIINDTCGHAAGDELLRRLSKIFSSLIRKGDMVARLGGDEFAVLLPDCQLSNAEKIAESIRFAIERFRFEWQGTDFYIGISIGVVGIDQNCRDMNELMDDADIACYAAKGLGRNRIHVFFKEDANLSYRRVEIDWISRLNHFLTKDQITLQWQSIEPINDRYSNSVNREFFLRIQDEEGNLLNPSDFIPSAERFNLMPSIDRIVIDKAFNYLANTFLIRSTHPGLRTFFINLSGKSLHDPAFFAYVCERMDAYQLPPDLICFELEETAVISHLGHAVEFIKNIKRQGCLFALDGFGTELGSFSYLKLIPIDFIKIDGSIIRSMVDNVIDYSIADAINQIGHTTGIKTVAESVESDQILEKAKEIGLDYAQGYQIDYPAALPNFETDR